MPFIDPFEAVGGERRARRASERSFERSHFRFGSNLGFLHAIETGVSQVSHPSLSANDQSAYKSGVAGLPSYKTIVEPTSRPLMRKFHIIQPVVVTRRNDRKAEIAMQRNRLEVLEQNAP